MSVILGFLNMYIRDLFVQITFSVKKTHEYREFWVTASPNSWEHISGDVVAEITELWEGGVR